MSVIYEPKGKAREYCELAVNLYNGCSHGCSYCYAPKFTYKKHEDFINAKPRAGVVDQLEKEAPLYRGREVHLCFTCDPYQQIENNYFFTRMAIEILHRNGIKVVILTKGGKRSEKDFDLLEKNKHLSKYGATLTFTEDADSLKFEPGATLPGERFETLEKAHSLGVETWASLEPVIDPAQTLMIIERCKDFVDTFKVGKWNHNAEASKIDWRKFCHEAIDLLEKYNLNYYIKKDLIAYKN